MKPEKQLKRDLDHHHYMTSRISRAQIKKAVKRLKIYLRSKGYDVKLGEVNEAAALLHGFKDWNTLLANGFKVSPDKSEE